MSIDDVISTSEVSAWDIVFALATLLLTWVAFRAVQRATHAAVAKVSGLTENIRLLIVRVVKYLVLFMGIGVALTFLGAQIQPVLVVVVVVAALAFLAVRGVADNFGAGIVLQTRKPVMVGDEISSQGFVGIVTSLNGRSVVITTTDGQTVHLPNAGVLQHPLVNHSQHGHRRSEVEVRCRLTGHAELRRLINALKETMAETSAVRRDPDPSVLVGTIETDRVTLLVRFWTDPLDRVPASSAVVASIGMLLEDRELPGTVTSQVPAAPLTTSPDI